MALRASDEDRERTVDLLRAHQAAGRLTVDELEERSAPALAAVHVEDLAALTADLPGPGQAVAPGRRPSMPRVPGRASFSSRWKVRVPPDDAMADLMIHVAPALTAYGYDIVERSRTRLVLERRTTPGWVIVVCVGVSPFGLLARLARRKERIAIDLVERGGETVMVAQGVAPLPVR